MIATDLISGIVPVLGRQDSCEKAIDLMAEFNVGHLPVVTDGILEGLVSEDELLELFDEPVEKARIMSPEVSTSANAHLFEVIKAFNAFDLTLLPVVDEDHAYLGSITQKRVIKSFGQLNSLDEAGGIIVLEMKNRDYSLTEISRIVESNNAKIICSYADSYPEENRMEVTLKVNRNNLSDIIGTFERFEYEIKNAFLEDDYTRELKDRYNALMRYLNT